MKRARLTPQANQDLLEATRWMVRDNPSAAQAFQETIDIATQTLASHPLAGRERVEFADAPMRFLPLTGYPFIIVYNPDRKPPLVLRALHSARDLPEILKDLQSIPEIIN